MRGGESLGIYGCRNPASAAWRDRFTLQSNSDFLSIFLFLMVTLTPMSGCKGIIKWNSHYLKLNIYLKSRDFKLESMHTLSGTRAMCFK